MAWDLGVRWTGLGFMVQGLGSQKRRCAATVHHVVNPAHIVQGPSTRLRGEVGRVCMQVPSTSVARESWRGWPHAGSPSSDKDIQPLTRSFEWVKV